MGLPQLAVKEIAALLARAGIDDLFGSAKQGAAASAERDEPKEMDVVAVCALLALHGWVFPYRQRGTAHCLMQKPSSKLHRSEGCHLTK